MVLRRMSGGELEPRGGETCSKRARTGSVNQVCSNVGGEHDAAAAAAGRDRPPALRAHAHARRAARVALAPDDAARSRGRRRRRRVGRAGAQGARAVELTLTAPEGTSYLPVPAALRSATARIISPRSLSGRSTGDGALARAVAHLSGARVARSLTDFEPRSRAGRCPRSRRSKAEASPRFSAQRSPRRRMCGWMPERANGDSTSPRPNPQMLPKRTRRPSLQSRPKRTSPRWPSPRLSARIFWSRARASNGSNASFVPSVRA